MACDSPHYVVTDKHWQPKAVPVPCGKCPPCRKARVDDWVFRMQQEDRISLSSLFVTLTYDTQHVPMTEHGYMTLSKKDYQLFMKRLRQIQNRALAKQGLPKKQRPKLKYYVAGEYGPTGGRPHYHAILFGVVENSYVADAWSLGTVHIGTLSASSIAYTCKYIDKAPNVRLHRRDDRAREFSLMSKGLGANYLTPATVAYHRADLSRAYVTTDGRHKSRLPRYYRDRIYSELDKAKQQVLIENAAAERKAKKAVEVSRRYPGMHIDTYLSHERDGRFTRDRSAPKRQDL